MILNIRYLLSIIGVAFLMPLNAQNPKAIADNLFANGNYTKAIEAYKAVENLDEVYSKIAKAYVAIGNYDNALANYKNAVAANPNTTVLQYDYAKLLTKTKKYKDAKSFFRNLIRLDSLNPNYYYELGVVLEKQKDISEKLENIAGMSREEAKTELVNVMSEEARVDAAKMIQRIEEEANEEAEKRQLEREENKPQYYIAEDIKYRKRILLSGHKIYFDELRNTSQYTTYKNLLYRIKYYSKTNVIIDKEDVTIYEYLKPKQSIKYEYKTKLDIENAHRLSIQLIKAEIIK